MSQGKVVRRHASAKFVPRAARRVTTRRVDYRMLGLVSSTGGPNAFFQLLGPLGPDFPLPIMLVQHITSSFLEGFASWLESTCPFSIVIVKGRTSLAPGRIYMADRD